jgi:hypothetical protein
MDAFLRKVASLFNEANFVVSSLKAGSNTALVASGGDVTINAAGVPATSVTDERPWGITPKTGTSTHFARQDHTHGTPANPVAGSSGTIHLAKRTALGTEGSITVVNGLITAFTDPT